MPDIVKVDQYMTAGSLNYDGIPQNLPNISVPPKFD